jgi:ParB family chromosome partitioning protein
MKKRSLGSNIDIFLSRTKRPEITETSLPEGELRQLPVENLQRGRYQPRKQIAEETVRELADSIRAQGVIQPIVVRGIAKDQYEIIAGERRWRAAQLAGLKNIPALVKDIPDEAALAMALIENIQRENLNPLEEAVALQRLLDEFGMTHQQVAEAVGKSRTTVTNLLRLLNLQSGVKTLLEQGDLEMGHARALLALNDKSQNEAAAEIVKRGLSVRETEALVSKWQSIGTHLPHTAKKLDPNIAALQQSLSDKLGAAVNFQQRGNGKGKMVIHYNSLDELEGILERIK